MFSATLLAGLAALALVLTLLAMSATGDWHAGLVGDVERYVLALGALGFAVAAIGARTAPGAVWTVGVALASTIAVGVLAVLTFAGEDAGSPAIFETLATALGVLLVMELRRG